jgi:hypothetical protein
VRHDGFVGHATDLNESGDGAVDGFGGEVAEGEHLVFGEAGGAELLVGAVEEMLGGGVGSGACGFECQYGREGFEKTAMDGGGGFAVELLIDDGFDEGFEGRLGAGDAHGEGAGSLDELAEFGIGERKIRNGFRSIIAGRTWTAERARHLLTVSQVRENVFLESYRTTEGLTRIYMDDTDLRTGNSKDKRTGMARIKAKYRGPSLRSG